jgi:hypothetical protein
MKQQILMYSFHLKRRHVFIEVIFDTPLIA